MVVCIDHFELDVTLMRYAETPRVLAHHHDPIVSHHHLAGWVGAYYNLVSPEMERARVLTLASIPTLLNVNTAIYNHVTGNASLKFIGRNRHSSNNQASCTPSIILALTLQQEHLCTGLIPFKWVNKYSDLFFLQNSSILKCSVDDFTFLEQVSILASGTDFGH